MLDPKTEKLVKEISDKYRLSGDEKIGSVSVLIREYLAGVLNEGQLKKEVYQRFQFNNSTILNFVEEFERLVKEIKQIGIESVKKDLVALRFNELIEKFPEIKKQEIGIYDIYLSGEEASISPNIQNWITDYKLKKNDRQKTTVLNVGDYLYNNKNTQDLNDEEKEELSVVLNAYEKNEVVYYNILFEEIDFEIIKLLEKNKKIKLNFGSKIKPKFNSNVNITGFESKPYHDTDTSSNQFDLKPKPVTRVKKEDFFKKTKIKKDNQRNVLDLNNYI